MQSTRREFLDDFLAFVGSGTTGGTTVAANELKIGAYGDGGENEAISAGTLDTTYTKLIQAGPSTTEQAMLEYADSGGSGSTARATATFAGSQDWLMAVIVYKLSGGAAAVNCSPLILVGSGRCG